jgi:hypothetical protein
MRQFCLAGMAVVILSMPGSGVRVQAQTGDPVTVTPFAMGLNDPRGLTFGPDGHLYVAEAGDGSGSLSTIGLCDQVQPPVGPFVGGASARVLEFSQSGFAVVADDLPSSHASALIGGDKEGASAVTFAGNRLFALLAGAGCSHAHADANNGILSLDRQGVSMLTDLSAWLHANPGAKGAQTPRDPDYEPDGVWYSMLFAKGRIYTVEPNHGLLVSVHPSSGDVELVNDLFATFGDHTYTTLAEDRGDLYIGTLGQIAFGPAGPPVPDFEHSFEAGVYKISTNGVATQIASGLHAVLGLAFDSHHRLYVLQSPIFIPGTGSLVRLDDQGTAETLVSGLTFPSGLTRGPDGAFYISACGYQCNPGQGGILRVAVGDSK